MSPPRHLPRPLPTHGTSPSGGARFSSFWSRRSGTGRMPSSARRTSRDRPRPSVSRRASGIWLRIAGSRRRWRRSSHSCRRPSAMPETPLLRRHDRRGIPLCGSSRLSFLRRQLSFSASAGSSVRVAGASFGEESATGDVGYTPAALAAFAERSRAGRERARGTPAACRRRKVRTPQSGPLGKSQRGRPRESATENRPPMVCSARATDTGKGETVV